MSGSSRLCSIDQQFLLPQDMRGRLPPDHPALIVSDMIDLLDLSPIFSAYASPGGAGQSPYPPAMMAKILVYGYCAGVVSSRDVEVATFTDVAFRVLSGNQHPDHAAFAAFRQRHLPQLAALVQQILALCRKAGLVRLGRIVLGGRRIRARAARLRSMSPRRMPEAEKRLLERIKHDLEKAVRDDEEDDRIYGKGVQGDDLPP